MKYKTTICIEYTLMNLFIDSCIATGIPVD